MNKHALSLAALAIAGAFMASACGGDDPPPQDPSQVQPGGYNPQPQPTYTQPAPTYPAPAGTAPAAAANPLALPCQADGGLCGTHKCNLATQKCSFPCAGPQDCMQGMGCMAGICLPGGSP